MSRNARGEGSVYKRKDGRWVGAVFVDTIGGKRKRVHVYGATRASVHEALAERIRDSRRGVRTPDTNVTVAEYVTYWIEEVASPKDRATTVERYRQIARTHLHPALGAKRLRDCSVRDAQAVFNQKLADGVSVRTVHAIRSLLRAALNQASREELVVRNVAALAQLPAWQRKPITPWSVDEMTMFLTSVRGHRWYGAFALLLLYGMRRGEVLGLTWDRVDEARGTIRVDQQLQRLDGRLQLAPVKTAASNRDLPLTAHLRDVLAEVPVRAEGNDLRLVFTAKSGGPIDPHNFTRAFHELREKAGVRRITVHHTRHTAATVLKNLGVSARDAQLILGHSHVTTTQQLYQHADPEGQREALNLLERTLTAAPVAVRSAVNGELSTGQGSEIAALTSGGPGGARTLDTLLKSVLDGLPTTTVTSVIEHAQTCTYRHLVGSVAVRSAVIASIGSPVGSAEHVEALRVLRRHQTHRVRDKCFPHVLLSNQKQGKRRDAPEGRGVK